MVVAEETNDNDLNESSNDRLPGNATNFWTMKDGQFIGLFNSAKNYTYVPGQIFNRMRERTHARFSKITDMYHRVRERMQNRTVSLLDRILGTFDRQRDKSGNETNREMFSNIRTILEALRNTIQGMVESNRRGPNKWNKEDKLDDELERESPIDTNSIKDLNLALKKLDKATRDKYENL